jgi:hypothetical protein
MRRTSDCVRNAGIATIAALLIGRTVRIAMEG